MGGCKPTSPQRWPEPVPFKCRVATGLKPGFSKVVIPRKSLGVRPASLRRLLWSNSLLHVNLDWTKDLFMPLDGLVQGTEQSLGSVEVDDDSLVDFNRTSIRAQRISVHSEVDDHLFGAACNAAEVGVATVSF